MRAALDVSSLRDDEERQQPEPTAQFNARLPSSVLLHIKSEAQGPGRTQASVVVDAIRLDKELAERLAEHKDDLRAFAQERGLTLARNLAEVLSELVVAGLKAHKKSRK